jgi:hypothetical protein
MPRKIGYDWRRLKIEYLLSEYGSVREWARQTESKLPAFNNSSFITHTAGWKEEKEKMLDIKNQLTIDLLVKKNAKINAKMYEVFLNKIIAVISSAEYMNAKELKALWHMIRVENGLVTNIAKNENLNTNFEENDKDSFERLLNAPIDNVEPNKNLALENSQGELEIGKEPQ